MVALAFIGMYLMRATPAGPLGLIIGFVTFYALTYADQFPLPEALVRAILWLWVVIGYPVALLALSDLAFGSRPEEVYRSGIAERLGAAADFLAAGERDAKQRTRLGRFVRLGASDLAPYVQRGGTAATAPIRAALLRQTELLGFLLHELPEKIQQSPAARPTLVRASIACDGARNALLERNGATRHDFELMAAERRALETETPATRAVVLPLVNCIQTIALGVHQLCSAPTAEVAPSRRASKPKSQPDTTEAVRFALKVTLAATVAYLLYSGLEWYSIHTATITCFFVAEENVGATIHKLTLRLTGAIIGAGLGMLSIIFVLPAFESVGGLAVLVAAVTLLAAWVGTASPRIAYIGWQIAISFYLTVLQGFSRTSKLHVGRDRVIGIIIGNILMSVVFTSLWPVHAAPTMRRETSRAVDALAAMLGTATDDRATLDRAEADFYAHLTTARKIMPLLLFERTRGDRGRALTVLQGLFIPVNALVRTPVPKAASPTALAALSSVTAGLSNWLRALAASIASQAATPTFEVPEAIVDLERIVGGAGEPPEALEGLRLHLEWFELLRTQIAQVAERGPV
jgi:multidrug resistance protein MdtO